MTAPASHLRFEGFVVGAGNRLAATAARSVAEAPGAVYNPLFIYAGPGLGKTHLLTAVACAARQINPQLGIEYLTTEQLVDAFHGAISTGRVESYRGRFASLDILLLDDLQFLSGQREMQAELLRLVDAMQQAGRQIIMASDRPPADIDALDERLVRRFTGGLVVDITAPDFETRVAILRRRAEQRSLQFLPDVLEAVAQPGYESVRELLGAMHRLVARQAAQATPVTASEAGELASAHQASAAPPPAPSAGRGDESITLADEFADFLQEVSATVAEQVEAWRTRVAEAIVRWEGEGFRVSRLHAMLEAGALEHDPATQLQAFEDDIEQLRAIEADVAAIAPDLAGDQVLRDPDQLDAARGLLVRAREGIEPPPGPSSHWRLDEFVESAGNRVAVRAVRAAIKDPGQRYNPLVLVAASGNGKTHLLHAFANGLQARGLTVACLSTHEFVEDLIAAHEQDQIPLWRARWRRVEALLLDDIQLIAEKERSQEELFLLFNDLSARGAPMAFTSAVAPGALQGVERRLRTRLEGGLVVELPPPDRELRHRLIERLLSARLAAIDPALPGYLAAQPADSVRAVGVMVARIAQTADTRGRDADLALAREVIEGSVARTPRPTSRPSGVVPIAAAGIQSREKMVWEWPDLGDHISEEWR